MSARDSARSTGSAKERVERRMVRQREREYDHQLKWNRQVDYYKSWEKNNAKFEEWTSPRYYETSNRRLQELKEAEERKDKLEKRRQKLRQLLNEEENSYNIELTVKSRNKYSSSSSKLSDMPTEVLRDVNMGLKLAEDEKQRREAELALYNHWRNNNPTLREHRRALDAKNVKLAWLDQQIEKKREQERREEENRKLLADTRKRLDEDKAKMDRLELDTAERNEQLRLDLEKQIEELQLSQKRSEELRECEIEAENELGKLFELEEKYREERRREEKCQLDLENMHHHKLKLRQRAANLRENLEYEQSLVERLRQSEAADKMEDETKKAQIKRSMDDFLKFVQDQKDLEAKRQKYFDFVFDSEAKMVFERQEALWKNEEEARRELLNSVFGTIKDQIREKIEKNKNKQRESVHEREDIIKNIEEYDQSMRDNEEEKKRKLDEWKREIDAQIKEKAVRERQEKLAEQKKMSYELETARKEEERLEKEIAKLQKRQEPIRHVRSRIIF